MHTPRTHPALATHVFDKGVTRSFVHSVTKRIREVAIAFTTRMTYFRVCLTTGSKGEPARIIWGLLPSAVIDKLPVAIPAALASDAGTPPRHRRWGIRLRRAQVAAGKLAG